MSEVLFVGKEGLPAASGPAAQERIRQLETERQAAVGRVALAAENLALAENQLDRAEMGIASIKYGQEAADCRAG